MRELRSVLGVVIAASAAAAAAAPLGYVEVSAGLEVPLMEGGRTELAVGDVDGDGHLDLASVGDHGSPWVNSDQHGVMIWFGDGGSSWSVVQTGEFGYGGVALGDVDGDGVTDVAYGVHHAWSGGGDLGDQLLEVALGDGTGGAWFPWDDGLASAGETWGMFGVDLADVDADGDLDVGANSFGCCAGFHVYLNLGNGRWRHAYGALNGNSGNDAVFGDVDGDGWPDLVTARSDAVVHRNRGGHGFEVLDGGLARESCRTDVALGDLDGDGRDDLACVGAGHLTAWTLGGGGTWHPLGSGLADPGDAAEVEVADMDDGPPEELVVLSESGAIEVLALSPGGTWSVAGSAAVSAGDPAAMTAGADLDHNGRGDVVAVVDDRWAQLWWANQPHALLEDTPRGGTALRVVRPRAAETWVAGSARFVEWRLALPPGAAVPTVDAAVWCDGAPTGTAVANLPGGGIAQLVVAPTSPPSSDCRLRLSLPSLPGVVAESASFTVVPGPWVFGDGFETGGLGAWGGTAPVAVRLPFERW